MKKINVIQHNYDFESIIKNNRPFKTRSFIIYLDSNFNDEYYKFGISVGKKVGNAVMRNRIKRQIRSIIDKKNYKNGTKCIIIVRKEILSKSFQEMESELFFAFDKIKIIKEQDDEK